MKGQIRNKFIVKSAIICLIATVLCYFILSYFTKPNHWFVLITPLIVFAINLLAFNISSGKAAQRNFNLQIVLLFAIKFFAYILLSAFFYLKESSTTQRLIFISIIFVLYLANTIVLLGDLTKFYKSGSNS
jgi:hypothetical protein